MEYKKSESKLVSELLKAKHDYQEIKSILSHLDDLESIFIVICSRQKVAYINEAGCKLLSSDFQSIIGINWFENFIPFEDREESKLCFEQIMSGELKGFHTQASHVLANTGDKIAVNWDNSLVKSFQSNSVFALFSLGKEIISQNVVNISDYKLTAREVEVLTRFARGFNAKEVSKQLNIQPKTVHAHKINIFGKMKFSNQRELVSFAIKRRLITLEDLIFG